MDQRAGDRNLVEAVKGLEIVVVGRTSPSRGWGTQIRSGTLTASAHASYIRRGGGLVVRNAGGLCETGGGQGAPP